MGGSFGVGFGVGLGVALGVTALGATAPSTSTTLCTPPAEAPVGPMRAVEALVTPVLSKVAVSPAASATPLAAPTIVLRTCVLRCPRRTVALTAPASAESAAVAGTLSRWG